MVPDVEPVCSLMEVVPLAKTAAVVFAGMENVTVFPPVENWMAGSALNPSGVAVIVRVPVTARG